MAQLTPHLTSEMRRAALAYAARLAGRGIDRDLAMEEATRLARRNLLTVAGYKKKAGAARAKKATKKGR